MSDDNREFENIESENKIEEQRNPEAGHPTPESGAGQREPETESGQRESKPEAGSRPKKNNNGFFYGFTTDSAPSSNNNDRRGSSDNRRGSGFSDNRQGNGFSDNRQGSGSGAQNQNGGKKPAGKKRNRLALILFAALIIMFAATLLTQSDEGTTVSYSTFWQLVGNGQVVSAEIKSEQTIVFYYLANQYDSMTTVANCRIPYTDLSLIPDLLAAGVNIVGSVQQVSFFSYVLQYLPFIIYIVIIIVIFRNTAVNGNMMNLGKTTAKEYVDKNNKTTFADVAGQKEAKYELQEVVEFLKNPGKFKEIGARIPKGCLLVGPPGTGKTLLARAVAGEAGVSFLYTSGSDFVEMFVGMGAARVRDLFNQARQHAPAIIFIDELDAVGRARGSGLGGGHDEREQTLNQMLVEMDGFGSDTNVIVMAATNRPDVLDPALLRPGRFDRQVTVDLPDVKEREDILKIHTKKVRLDDNVDLSRIARATSGCSGADLANIVNEAALLAARAEKRIVSMPEFEQARDKVLFGVAKKSKAMTAEEKTATAYHEAGHTLLYYYLKHLDPLHKVTIIPHGQALGITMSLPEKDTLSMNKGHLEDFIKVCMGGYVAEDLVYGLTTTGTSNDIKQATGIARRMVTEWGMSSLGFVSLGDEDEPLFLGRSLARHKDYSEETAKRIDEEINKIMDKCMAEVRQILGDHRDQLDTLTRELVAKETLDDAEIRELLGFEARENITSLK